MGILRLSTRFFFRLRLTMLMFFFPIAALCLHKLFRSKTPSGFLGLHLSLFNISYLFVTIRDYWQLSQWYPQLWSIIFLYPDDIPIVVIMPVADHSISSKTDPAAEPPNHEPQAGGSCISHRRGGGRICQIPRRRDVGRPDLLVDLPVDIGWILVDLDEQNTGEYIYIHV